MADTADDAQRAPATQRLGLLVAGLALLVVGGLGALLAKGAAEQQATVDSYTAALGGTLASADPDYTVMWLLVVVAALGAVALIVRAASPVGS